MLTPLSSPSQLSPARDPAPPRRQPARIRPDHEADIGTIEPIGQGCETRCMDSLPQPAPEEFRLSALLHALADPVRRALVRNLATQGELSCTQSLGLLRLPKSTLANHYRVMRDAGLVTGRPCGKQVINRLRREELDARFPGLLDAVLRVEEDAA